MKEFLQTFPPLEKLRELWELATWPSDKPGMPHLSKQATINFYRQKYGLKILVESGTYLGEMVYAQKDKFEKVYSVELAHALFLRAQKRFKKYPQVAILEGDSAAVLSGLSQKLDKPTLFWLDGHYSGGLTARANEDTPISGELAAIFQNMNQNFAILIDDARLFVGQYGYPTLPNLKLIIEKFDSNFSVDVEQDIIAVCKK